MTTSTPPSPLLTIPQVARYLGVSRERCYRMAAAGEIPSVRLSPRRVRVPQRALEAWVAEQLEPAHEDRRD